MTTLLNCLKGRHRYDLTRALQATIEVFDDLVDQLEQLAEMEAVATLTRSGLTRLAATVLNSASLLLVLSTPPGTPVARWGQITQYSH